MPSHEGVTTRHRIVVRPFRGDNPWPSRSGRHQTGAPSAGNELAAALRRELSDVRDDAYTRHLYASDASMYAREPLVVACPRDAAEVAAAIAVAGRFDVPVVARAAAARAWPGRRSAGSGIVLDTSRHMSAIGEIDTDARRVRVGPGVVQEDLNRAAQRLGFGFGPDTSTSNRATIGGMIGNNSSGSHSIVYGSTIDHVHELEVVLADGSTATLGPGAGPSSRTGCARSCATTPTRSPPPIRSTGARPAATGSTTWRASSTWPSS